MIRKANINDAERVHTLLEQIYLFHHNLSPEDFPGVGSKYTFEEVQAMLEDKSKTIIVYDDGVVEGYLIGWFNGSCFFIDDLCVDENSRGKSIGKKLISYVEDVLKFEHIQLNVWLRNSSAIAFYEKLGFAPLKYVMRKKK